MSYNKRNFTITIRVTNNTTSIGFEIDCNELRYNGDCSTFKSVARLVRVVRLYRPPTAGRACKSRQAVQATDVRLHR